jgi:hypothetical protein
MPVIRKLWPKFALKEALETEVAKTPRFVVSYTKPYMFKGDANGVEERVYLPRGLKDQNGFTTAAAKKEYTAVVEKAVANGAAVVVDFSEDPAVKVANTPSAVKYQPLDELVVEEAKLADGTVVKFGKRLGVDGSGIYDVKEGQLVVRFDGAHRKATFALVGLEGETLTIRCRAGVSSEYNEQSWSIGFDIARQDIDIPTGQHINAPLPIEALNDMMALYQIDGTKETVDLMTNVFAMKLDLEVMDFIVDSYLEQPRNEAFNYLPEVGNYTVVFDCKPAAGFAGSPKAWREELKPLIDHLAQRIKNATYLQAGAFSIVANPLDAQLLANVDWSFRGGQGENMDGVSVDYSVGTYVGANAYKVISSVNVPSGAMYVVFTPRSNTQMTYKYYPYTFSTEMGYIDPNRSRTPSIMMTKRHTFHEFMPAVGCVYVQNNLGNWFNEYTSWKEVQ